MRRPLLHVAVLSAFALVGCGRDAEKSAAADEGTRASASPPAPQSAGKQASSVAPVPTGAPAVAPKDEAKLYDLKYGPVTIFAQRCSRCHGPEGMMYPPTHATLTEPQLIAKVSEMTRGNAQLQPDAPDIAGLVAYERSLQQKRPFLVIVNASAFAEKRDKTLRGEVSPDSTVTATAAGRPMKVVQDGMTFAIDDPPAGPLTIQAERRGETAQLEFPTSQWSR